jgi:hypothetical protein
MFSLMLLWSLFLMSFIAHAQVTEPIEIVIDSARNKRLQLSIEANKSKETVPVLRIDLAEGTPSFNFSLEELVPEWGIATDSILLDYFQLPEDNLFKSLSIRRGRIIVQPEPFASGETEVLLLIPKATDTLHIGSIIFKIDPIANQPELVTNDLFFNKMSPANMMIKRNPFDGPEVTHVLITEIKNGLLFQADTLLPISAGTFLPFDSSGTLELRFMPFDRNASIKAQSALGSGIQFIGGKETSLSKRPSSPPKEQEVSVFPFYKYNYWKLKIPLYLVGQLAIMYDLQGNYFTDFVLQSDQLSLDISDIPLGEYLLQIEDEFYYLVFRSRK